MILFKKRIYTFSIFIILIPCLYGMPKYTDKKNALELATVLDKGIFKGKRIVSTYVKNRTAKDYFITVILSDESAHAWYLDTIFKWVQNDDLQLTRNRSLVFLDPKNSSVFSVLDKNKFHRLALKAKVYIKEYKSGDPLAGKKIHYRIKSFNLISLDEEGYGKNSSGERYRYIIDLANGTRELLTYSDAYLVLKNKYLLETDDPIIPTVENVYHITRIVPYPKTEIIEGVSQFGIEITFDHPIQLQPDHFQFEMYEKKFKVKKRSRQGFVFDLTLPNTTNKYPIQSIPNLEYLSKIEIHKDFRYDKRLLLRAKFNPNIMDIPPLISQTGSRSIYVTFFHLVDQTIYNRKLLLEKQKKAQQEVYSKKEFEISPKVNTNSDFGQKLLAAVDIFNEANEQKELPLMVEGLLFSVDQFEEAALLANDDNQLVNALEQRNKARKHALLKIIELAQMKLDGKGVSQSPKKIIENLKTAESFTQDHRFLLEISTLKNQLLELN